MKRGKCFFAMRFVLEDFIRLNVLCWFDYTGVRTRDTRKF